MVFPSPPDQEIKDGGGTADEGQIRVSGSRGDSNYRGNEKQGSRAACPGIRNAEFTADMTKQRNGRDQEGKMNEPGGGVRPDREGRHKQHLQSLREQRIEFHAIGKRMQPNILEDKTQVISYRVRLDLGRECIDKIDSAVTCKQGAEVPDHAGKRRDGNAAQSHRCDCYDGRSCR